jgi:GNAT superfamily N-acetyltransferase
VGIERVAPDDRETLRSWYDVYAAAREHDNADAPLQTFEELAAQAATEDRTTYQRVMLLGVHDGTPVSAASLRLTMRDNLDTADLALTVHPEHRRRGHGRRLAEAALTEVRRAGRHRVVSEIEENLDGSDSAGPQFAASLGARRARVETHRALDLTDVDEPAIAALQAKAESRSHGYELVQWVGPAPDDLVADYAALIGRLSTDAPHDDLDWEPESWDTDRVRRRDVMIAAQRRRLVVTAARPVGGGPLVAYTDVGLATHDPDNAVQWDTLVHADHRGHRLGALVKVANLELVRREAPHAKRLHTWNADSNSYMLAINEAMGFVPLGRESEWQLDLDRAGD